MKLLLSILAAACLTMCFAQEHLVPSHYTKTGRYVAAHMVKTRHRAKKPKDGWVGLKAPIRHRKPKRADAAARMYAEGRHWETRVYPGHYAKDGHYVAAHSQNVWARERKPKKPDLPTPNA